MLESLDWRRSFEGITCIESTAVWNAKSSATARKTNRCMLGSWMEEDLIEVELRDELSKLQSVLRVRCDFILFES